MIAHARAKYEAHQEKAALSEKALHDRAVKGWETRRKNNPTLKNIHRVGKKDFEWHRPNGEVVPLRNFTGDQVELMSAAMHVTDMHLKKSQKLHTEITGRKLPVHNAVANLTGARMGGYMRPLRVTGWSDINPVVMNKHTLDNPNPSFAPASILTHEIGHLVGPGSDVHFGPTPANREGHTTKEINKFEKAFQWEAPRFKPAKRYGPGVFQLDRKGDLKPEFVDMRHLWRMTKKHPQAVKSYGVGPNEGLASQVRPAYQTVNHLEDFAETYRSYLGMPMDTDGTPKSAHWDWKDRKQKRREYMENTHLSKAAKHNQYIKLIQEAQARHDSE